MTHTLENNSLDISIAIIGMYCRVPGSKNVNEFWKNLKEGKESIVFLNKEELIASGIPEELVKQSNYIPAYSGIDGIEFFDAEFFGYSPREAKLIDPQHRIFLEGAWKTLEDAGYCPQNYKGKIGIFAGSGTNQYVYRVYDTLMKKGEISDFELMIGNDKDFLTTRVAYKLNLTGPALNIQTACSTSLVTVHLACQSLINGDCNMALAGGVSINSLEKCGYLYQEGMVFSPDGHCRSFDINAAGTIPASGVGIVILKPLEDAIRDNDNIYAIIRGSAINNDGNLKVGYTAPSVNGQHAVISEALNIAGINPNTVQYIETHGTATSLGDAIEIAALKKGYNTQNCLLPITLGALKTNLGHLDAAAGIMGLIKTALILYNKQIPPTLHFQTPNPKLSLESREFRINTQLEEWNSNGQVRRAAVSSFGIGGTNAHVILEEAPIKLNSIMSKTSEETFIIPISAKSSNSLDKAINELDNYLSSNLDVDIKNLAFTFQSGREHFNCRRYFLAKSSEELRNIITTFDQDYTESAEIYGKPNVVFMFSGHGSEYINMGRSFYDHEPIFKECIDECAKNLKDFINYDIVSILYPKQEDINNAQTFFHKNSFTQPILFSVEYATAKLLIHYGICPNAMIGHSSGEYVAACIAGVFDLRTALHLIFIRGKLIEEYALGGMILILNSLEKIKPYLSDRISLSAINGPNIHVVAGLKEDIADLETKLISENIDYRIIHTPYAGHSHLTEKLLPTFLSHIKEINLRSPTIPYISTYTGSWIKDYEATEPKHWLGHTRHTVRFEEGIKELIKKENQVFIEVGPGRGLSLFAKACFKNEDDFPIIATMPYNKKENNINQLSKTLASLWMVGMSIKWDLLNNNKNTARISLPTYNFEMTKFWIDKDTIDNGIGSLNFVEKRDIEKWFYIRNWKQFTYENHSSFLPLMEPILVFVDENKLSNDLIDALKSRYSAIIKITKESFFKNDANEINKSFFKLFEELKAKNQIPKNIIYAWSLQQYQIDDIKNYYNKGMDDNFYSIINIVQNIGKLYFSEQINIIILTANCFFINKNDCIDPIKSAIIGPLKVIPKEYPNLICKLVDINNNSDLKSLINIGFLEKTLSTKEEIFVYRNLECYFPSYKNITIPENHWNFTFKDGGTYVITGGTGGIGLEIAKFIASKANAKIILVSRLNMPPHNLWDLWLNIFGTDDKISKVIKAIKIIEKNISYPIEIYSANIANPDEVKEMIYNISSKSNINGIIHAAGQVTGGVIQLKTFKDLEKVLAPKVLGTIALDYYTKNIELDFLILFSSLTAISGDSGQIDHCGANNFLDAFSFYRNNHLKRTLSINWDTWNETGGAVDASKHDLNYLQSRETYQPIQNNIFKFSKSIGEYDYTYVATSESIKSELFIDLNSEEISIYMILSLLHSFLSLNANYIHNFSLKNLKVSRHFKNKIMATTSRIQVSSKMITLDAISKSGRKEILRANIEEARTSIRSNEISEPNKTLFNKNNNIFKVKFNTESGVKNELSVNYIILNKEIYLYNFKLPTKLKNYNFAIIDICVKFIQSYIKKSTENYSINYIDVNNNIIKSKAKIARISLNMSNKKDIEIDIFDYSHKSILKIEGIKFYSNDTIKIDKTKDNLNLKSNLEINKYLKHGISNNEGIEAFNMVTSYPFPQIIISTTDLYKRINHEILSNNDNSNNNEKIQRTKSVNRKKLDNCYISPNNEIERDLVTIWQNFLKIDKIGANDDFFELGGNSLIAIQLINKINIDLKVKLVPSILIENSTIRALAKVIESMKNADNNSEVLLKQEYANIIRLKSGNINKPIIFLIHPAGGTVYFYRDFANALSTKIEVYGIQADFNTDIKASNLKEIASSYLELIKTIQPEGPYILGGASFGGAAAFEIAQQLINNKQQVELLFMIDTPGTTQKRKMEMSNIEVFAYLLDLDVDFDKVPSGFYNFSFEEQLEYLMLNTKNKDSSFKNMKIESLLKIFKICKDNAEALWSYNPDVYKGDLLYFLAKERDNFTPENPDKWWKEYVNGKFLVYPISGNHIDMNKSPNVDEITAIIDYFLQIK